MFLDEEEHESHWPEVRFYLMWTEHGGSGLRMSFSEINELDYEDILWLFERMQKQKKDEADALKRR